MDGDWLPVLSLDSADKNRFCELFNGPAGFFHSAALPLCRAMILQGHQKLDGHNGVYVRPLEVRKPFPVTVQHISSLYGIFQFNLIIICHNGFKRHFLQQLCPSLSLIFKE